MNKTSPKALILVAQDPYLDPRVSYEALNLKELGYEVDVVGFHNPSRTSRKAFSREIHVSELKNRSHLLLKGLIASTRFIRVLPFYVTLFLLISLPLFVVFDFVFGLFLGTLILIKNLVIELVKYTFITRQVLKILIQKLVYRPVQSSKKAMRAVRSVHRIVSLIIPNIVLIGAGTELKKNNYSVIICCDIDSLIAGVFLKINSNARLVYDSHELWPYVYPEKYFLDTKLISTVEGFFLKFVDQIFIVSGFLKTEMSKIYSIDAKKISVIPNVEPLNLEMPPHSTRESGPARDLKFLFIGGFAPGRGLLQLIENWQFVMESYPNLQAQLLLQGPDSKFKQECVELAAKTGLLDTKIFFPNSISEDKIIEACQMADVGIIPYEPVCLNHEGCSPNKLGQFLKAGLPIFSNSLANIKGVLEESNAGISCDFTDREKFIKSIIALMDTQFRNQLSKNAQEYSARAYNWKAFQPVFKEAVQVDSNRVS